MLPVLCFRYNAFALKVSESAKSRVNNCVMLPDGKRCTCKLFESMRVSSTLYVFDNGLFADIEIHYTAQKKRSIIIGMDITEFASEEDYAAQAATGALLNPRIDSTFKALFTQNTPESQEALKAFLEAATERKIAFCHPIPNDAPLEFAGQRGVSYDCV